VKSLAERLSRQQRGILVALLPYVAAAEERGISRGTFPWHRCVPLKWLRQGADKTPAACAAFSRALRRLEGRGLIVRTNATSGMSSAQGNRTMRLLASEPHATRTESCTADRGR
jgi:hypothetical protein